MAAREFHFQDGTANKFWTIELGANSYTVHFGRMGTAGQTQTKEFSSEAAAQAAYDKSVAYLADREAFGMRLLDEPTIRFTLADMATTLEASRNLLWRAASALDADHPDKVELCAMAKRYVTDACFTVADQALQLHGGYGYLREYGLEKIVRDLRVHRILEGTNEIMRVVIGRAEAARVRAS